MDRDALTARIASGRTDLVHELIALPSPWPLFEGASPLQWCAYYGDVSALRLLLANGAGLHEQRTVKAHLSAIFERLGVRNRTQAGVLLRSLEVVDPAKVPLVG
jgi:hypothetical protein